MRDAFHEDLDTITDQLVEMTHLAGSAMSRATTALLDADVHLAESVIAADDELDQMRENLDALSIDLLARQQPVATDLRIVVTSMRMSSDLERMGDLARHIAKVARLRYPEKAVPAALTSHILEIVERLSTHNGVIARGRMVAQGSIDDLRAGGAAGQSLEELFISLVGGDAKPSAALDWV